MFAVQGTPSCYQAIAALKGGRRLTISGDREPARLELFYRLFPAIKTGPNARNSLETTVEWAFWVIPHEAMAF